MTHYTIITSNFPAHVTTQLRKNLEAFFPVSASIHSINTKRPEQTKQLPTALQSIKVSWTDPNPLEDDPTSPWCVLHCPPPSQMEPIIDSFINGYCAAYGLMLPPSVATSQEHQS